MSGYTSQSSCHPLNTGSVSEGVFYHRFNEFDLAEHMEKLTFEVRLTFKDVRYLRMALSQFAILHSFDMKFVKKDKERVIVKCADDQCGWRLHASVLKDGGTLVIGKYKNTHSCASVN